MVASHYIFSIHPPECNAGRGATGPPAPDGRCAPAEGAATDRGRSRSSTLTPTAVT